MKVHFVETLHGQTHTKIKYALVFFQIKHFCSMLLPLWLCLPSSFPQVPILVSDGSLPRPIFLFPSSPSHPLAFHICWLLFFSGGGGEKWQGRGWFLVFVFFFQCHPHPSFSVIEGPQITASILQPLPFLFPNKFHCTNVLIFFFTKLKPTLLPSVFVTASQSCFSLSDRYQNERNIGLHIQDAFLRLRECHVELHRLYPLSTVLCTRMRKLRSCCSSRETAET